MSKQDLIEAAAKYAELAHGILADDAVCDHSVGICWCDYQRSLGDLYDALAQARGEIEIDRLTLSAEARAEGK